MYFQVKSTQNYKYPHHTREIPLSNAKESCYPTNKFSNSWNNCHSSSWENRVLFGETIAVTNLFTNNFLVTLLGKELKCWFLLFLLNIRMSPLEWRLETLWKWETHHHYFQSCIVTSNPSHLWGTCIGPLTLTQYRTLPIGPQKHFPKFTREKYEDVDNHILAFIVSCGILWVNEDVFVWLFYQKPR